MSEIPVQFAERYIKRKQTNAVGKSLLKTLTEPITNSDDSYRRTVESESGHSKTVFPITIFVDKAKRMVRLIDQAQGMSADELEKKFATHDRAIAEVIAAIRQLTAAPEPKRRGIGFVIDKD